MGLKSYLAPGRKADKGKEPVVEVPMSEKVHTGTSTPQHLAPMSGAATPYGSRPVSVFPEGDFRNNAKEEINDIKCDMMVNHLYSQQMELLWTAGGHDEGALLKKSRGQYACCPSDLESEPNGFFKAIQTLNVRVSKASSTFSVYSLTSYPECHDRQHSCYQALPSRKRPCLHPLEERSPSPGPP